MKKLIVLVLAVAWLVAAMGCNTVAGVGEDLQSAGEKIEGAAKKR